MHDVNTAFEAPLPVEKSAERFPPQDLWRFDRESRRKFHPDFNAVFRRWCQSVWSIGYGRQCL
jgi:hypothetical protein